VTRLVQDHVLRHLRFALWVVAGLVAPALIGAATPEPSADSRPDLRFFEERIRPVLSAKCYPCHSVEADKQKGGLLLDTREGIRAGGESGHAIVPGDPDASLLLKAIRGVDKDFTMPPKERLTDAVVADFERWIRLGAPDPREGGGRTRKELPRSDLKTHWAFQPVAQPHPAPVPTNAAWARSDVDRFVLSRLEAEGIRPVADADPRTLLRRLSFDLTGLPPTPERLDRFVAACGPRGEIPQAALEQVVDEFLASPAFGERWGRHWLDVARFAESTGKERNHTFPEAWRYRDWVIAALNADQPYDQFVREQVAGDLLADADPARTDALTVATGFLAVGPKGLNEPRREQFVADLVDEQIDVTTRAVMGLTVACARCHDHKFDPVSQRDYYAMAGIFRSTETLYGTEGVRPLNRHASSLIPLESSPRAALLAFNPILEPRARSTEPARTETGPASKDSARPKSARDTRREARREAAKKTVRKTILGASGIADNRATNALAMGVRDAAKPADTFLLVRGEVTQRDGKVPRGLMPAFNAAATSRIPSDESGRRQLADWLTHPKNPLTARVAVNRIWLHLFGQGLVTTPDDFGAMGSKPSHPELLDHLAGRFVAQGWSTKRLIREIVLSHVYQLSSDVQPGAYDHDPDNALLWRMTPRRLEAEALRDAMMAASGELDAKPFHGSVIAQIGDTFVGGRLPTERFNELFKHRSVYLPVVRDALVDGLDVFDAAEPSLVMSDRDTTTVPAQALYLLNSPFVQSQASALADRTQADAGTDDRRRINRAYELTLGRRPTAAEADRALRFVRDASATPAARKNLWTAFAQSLFACAEFRYLR
jgi:hypothetical protein